MKNELEKALEKDDSMVDIYLEDTPTWKIRADIEEIRKKAAMQTDGGRLREALKELISDNI